MISNRSCELWHLLNYAARIFGRANKWFTENSWIVSKSPKTVAAVEMCEFPRAHRAAMQRDTICMPHATCDRECEYSKSVIGFRSSCGWTLI